MTKKKKIKLVRNLRSSVLSLRLTSAERSRWEAMAEEVGLGNNVSKFVRHCVERRSLPAPIPQINEQIYWELGKIGVNLNQITHAINRAVKEGQGVAVDPRPEIQVLPYLVCQIITSLVPYILPS